MAGKVSRWAVVVGDRFDWWTTPRSMRTYPRGDILFLPLRAIKLGEAAGVVQSIPRPPGYRVDKSGKVVRCSS